MPDIWEQENPELQVRSPSVSGLHVLEGTLQSVRLPSGLSLRVLLTGRTLLLNLASCA